MAREKLSANGKSGPPRKSKFRHRQAVGYTECSRFEWLNAIRSEQGPPHPQTRFVLFALSLHMKNEAATCFPSLALLARETGLATRTVKKHMNVAVADGWLIRTVRRGNASGFSSYSYRALIPDHMEEAGALNAPSDEVLGHLTTGAGALNAH
jgi:hypothetical protein